MSNDSRKFMCDCIDECGDEASVRPATTRGRFVVDANRIVLRDDEAVEFAEAVLAAAGVDAIIVTGLPEVTEENGRLVAGSCSIPLTVRLGADEYRQEAAESLALARWFEQHPPVDPQVQALASDLVEVAYDDPKGASREEHMKKWADVLHERGWRRE